MKEKGDMIRKQSWNRGAPDAGRHQAGGEDVVQGTAPGASGAISVPAGQMMPADERQEKNTRTIRGARAITQLRMPSIEVPRIHRAPYSRRRKIIKLKASRSRVNITELKESTTNLDLEELKRHVRASRSAEKTVRQGTVKVSQETIPYQVDVGNVAGKGRSLRGRVRPARKRLLKKDDRWVTREHKGLELKKLVKPGDTTDVPRK